MIDHISFGFTHLVEPYLNLSPSRNPLPDSTHAPILASRGRHSRSSRTAASLHIRKVPLIERKVQGFCGFDITIQWNRM